MPDPVRLLYRADWTRWSLSAEIVQRHNHTVAAQLEARLAADLRRHPGPIAALVAGGLAARRRILLGDQQTQRGASRAVGR